MVVGLLTAAAVPARGRPGRRRCRPLEYGTLKFTQLAPSFQRKAPRPSLA